MTASKHACMPLHLFPDPKLWHNGNRGSRRPCMSSRGAVFLSSLAAPLFSEGAGLSKVTVLQPNEPNPPAQVHDGWGKAKRKLDTSGAVLTELGRLYRRCAAGHLHPEDLKAGVWSLRQMADIAERAVLEQRIAELERKLAEAESDAL